MTKKQQAEQAQRLLNDPLISGFFIAREKELFAKFKETHPLDGEALQLICQHLACIEEMKGHFQAFIDDYDYEELINE